MRVLFYTHSPRAFRTTLIGHLHELTQVFPTVLLAEQLDQETETALANPALFPRLQQIVPVRQFTGSGLTLFERNRQSCRLARTVIARVRPEIVVVGSDTHSLFEMYLLRFAKQIGARTVAVQPTTIVENAGRAAVWVDFLNASRRFPAFLPWRLRLGLVRLRKYAGHSLYYWLLPALVGQRPFGGRASHVLHVGNSGMRDADVQVVFSARDRAAYLRDGVPEAKLRILPHPLARGARRVYEQAYFRRVGEDERDSGITVVLPEFEPGFKRAGGTVITPAARLEGWIRVLRLLADVFPQERIWVKPHPDIQGLAAVTSRLRAVLPTVIITDPSAPADRFVEMGWVIIGLPLAASTTLYTATLQCPGKPVFALDLHAEFLGDTYAGCDGITYLDGWAQLERALLDLRGEGRRTRRQRPAPPANADDAVALVRSLHVGGGR